MDLDDEKLREIGAARAAAAVGTRRATVAAMEELLYEPLPVLDHGFVRVVDYMGDDDAIVQAARVSYGRGTKQVSSDRRLINYLMRHRHTSPFEMCELKLHVKLPIFVARQWLRHRTASVNEYSARYSILDREFYIPDQEFLQQQKAEKRAAAATAQVSLFEAPAPATPKDTAAQSTSNKQGREELLERESAAGVLREMTRVSSAAFTSYEKLLGSEERPGVARELARIVLPVSTYTQFYWKVNLHNLMNFLALRADSHAQHEIRVYAELLLDVVRRWVPLTAAAFVEYRMDAVTLSKTALEVVRRTVAGEAVTRETSGLAAGEWNELVKLQLLRPA